LNTSRTHLVRASALAARPELKDLLRAEITAAREGGEVLRHELYEAFLQLYLFAGFPAALEAMRALEKLWPREHRNDEREAQSEVDRYPEFLARGRELYTRVYAKNAEVVEREMLRLSPELAAWAVVEGYGKTLSRQALDAPSRELCVVAILTQLGWDRQLFSHILGAKNVGASNEDILEAIAIGAMGDEQKAARGRELVERSQ
jgi:alkylhydroperoxidase/carboxymuconolactone decarboxylase family protein YurZ